MCDVAPSHAHVSMCVLAPEVLAMTGYTRAVDMWGVGVILYIL